MNSIGNSKGWINVSFGVRGLGEGSRVESEDGIGLDLTSEDSSTLDVTFAWRDLVLMMKEECFSMKCSRNSTCSIIVLCVKQPSTVMSRHRLAPMSIPKQKSHSNMLLGKDKSRPACINIENLAQATPIDSFLHCSKSRIALGRELIWDIGKNAT